MAANRIDPLELQRVVLDIVSRHVGLPNLIMRRDLVAEAAVRLGRQLLTQGQRDYFDRITRKAIEALRVLHDRGARICSTQDDHGGYWVAANDKELDDHLAVEEARATTIFQSVQTRRRLVKMANPAQMRLDVEVKEPARAF